MNSATIRNSTARSPASSASSIRSRDSSGTISDAAVLARLSTTTSASRRQ